ncbi:MAG: hypothetical protein CSA32_04255 [Desulfobulbus propionicus]|nr:MAG: hypothetical protein CSA32_04255 [Desulfobulbus propionicus]
MPADTLWNVDVALVHAPVVNQKGEITGSAVTNLDLHDIARAGKTFGIRKYWVITPYEQQQLLVAEILSHWLDGHGKKADSDRAAALSLISVCGDVLTAVAGAEEAYGEKPLLIATGAAAKENNLSWQQVRRKVQNKKPVFLLFGTAWGLAPAVTGMAQGMLPPVRGVRGVSKFNHLSVRSAVSIVLDRLLSEESMEREERQVI